MFMSGNFGISWEEKKSAGRNVLFSHLTYGLHNIALVRRGKLEVMRINSLSHHQARKATWDVEEDGPTGPWSTSLPTKALTPKLAIPMWRV